MFGVQAPGMRLVLLGVAECTVFEVWGLKEFEGLGIKALGFKALKFRLSGFGGVKGSAGLRALALKLVGLWHLINQEADVKVVVTRACCHK